MNNELTPEEIAAAKKALKNFKDGDHYTSLYKFSKSLDELSKPKDPIWEKYQEFRFWLQKHPPSHTNQRGYKKFLELFGPELNGAQGLRFQDISFDQFLQIFNNWTGGDADEEVIEKVYKELLANAKRNELLTGGGE